MKVWVGLAALTCAVFTLVPSVPPAGSPGAAGEPIVAAHQATTPATAPASAASANPATAAAALVPAGSGRAERPNPGQPNPGQAAANVAPVPVAVALDPGLSKPQPGDTAATSRARAALARADESYQIANQRYDQASAAAATAAAEVVRARQAAVTTARQAEVAHAEFAALVTAQYQGGDTPLGAQLMTAGDQQDFLAALDTQHTVALRDAGILTAARATQAAAAAARSRLEQADAAAADARLRTTAQLAVAARALASAQTSVQQLHLADLAAAAAAAADRQSNLGAAATAIQAQAIASGAAKAGDFTAATSPAQVIAIGARALLEKAARRQSGAPVDEQKIMGRAPYLGGTVAYSGTTGSGPALALTRFDGVVSASGWPNAGVGTKVRGTAPFQKPDGKFVHPSLPDYPARYVPLRAEVAVDAALARLGSPYVWDAAGPATFDCSGLTLWAWGHAGVALNHYTGEQVHEGVRVAPNQLLPGDLVLFGKTLHHVGMYLGAGYMIDAPTTGDYVKVQLVSDDGDFAVAVRP